MNDRHLIPVEPRAGGDHHLISRTARRGTWPACRRARGMPTDKAEPSDQNDGIGHPLDRHVALTPSLPNETSTTPARQRRRRRASSHLADVGPVFGHLCGQDALDHHLTDASLEHRRHRTTTHISRLHAQNGHSLDQPSTYHPPDDPAPSTPPTKAFGSTDFSPRFRRALTPSDLLRLLSMLQSSLRSIWNVTARW